MKGHIVRQNDCIIMFYGEIRTTIMTIRLLFVCHEWCSLSNMTAFGQGLSDCAAIVTACLKVVICMESELFGK